MARAQTSLHNDSPTALPFSHLSQSSAIKPNSLLSHTSPTDLLGRTGKSHRRQGHVEDPVALAIALVLLDQPIERVVAGLGASLATREAVQSPELVVELFLARLDLDEGPAILAQLFDRRLAPSVAEDLGTRGQEVVAVEVP